ncbi:DUF2911 domain-containing protein [Croceiramulus getboli]|nr:DUF2911 domain-containing protein [Flavobacteriaceae bacterium YJPT1-3]
MKSIFTTAILVLAFLAAPQAWAQFPGLQKSPTDIAYARADRNATPDIKVIYSRPQKNGRVIFGDLEAYGKVWRTGADEATEIKLYSDMMMGGKRIEAGTYSLFTIPGEEEWTVILSSQTDVWGAYSYDESKDVARIQVPAGKGDTLEVFSIMFKPVDNGYHMVMGWDDTRVEVPFKKA